MKKPILTLAATALTASMLAIPNVFAANYSEEVSTSADLKTCLLNTSDYVTCTLKEDIDNWSDAISISTGKNVTLDLAGHTLKASTGSMYILAGHGTNLTITGEGGKIVNEIVGQYPVSLYVYTNDNEDKPTKLTVDEGVTVSGITPVAILSEENGKYAELNIDGTLSENFDSSTAVGALTVNGKIGVEGIKINITGTLSSTVGSGIYQAGYSEIVTNGATISGISGIVTKGGTLTLNNTKVTATGDYAVGAPAAGGYNPTGAGIQIEENAGYSDGIIIKMNEGTEVTSTKGNALDVYGTIPDDKDEPSVTLSGNVNLIAAEGKHVLSNALTGNGKVEVKNDEGEDLDLTELSNYIDKTLLEGTIANAEQVYEGKDKYTDESVEALAEAIADAKKVLANANASAEEVQNALETVSAAVFNIELKPSEAEPETDLENPNTLDKAPAYLAVGAVALTGLVGLGYAVKKKFEN